ncbi:MAG: hypothetical protein WA902_09015 [Thermosynechococcaceae cyanobacterium]
MMKLSAYPGAIASLQHQLLDLDQQIISLTESVTLFASLIDKAIAFDTTLKNEAQRKAVKLERQQSDSDYYEAALALKNAKQKRDQLSIELELQRSQFSVAKLDMRCAIANLEAQVAA